MTTDRLRALLAEATPGPWEVSTVPGDTGTVWQTASGGAVAWVNEDHQTGDHHPYADAALIVAAVNALPSLLRELDAARDALEVISDGRHRDGHRGAVLVARDALAVFAALGKEPAP